MCTLAFGKTFLQELEDFDTPEWYLKMEGAEGFFFVSYLRVKCPLLVITVIFPYAEHILMERFAMEKACVSWLSVERQVQRHPGRHAVVHC